MTEKILYDACLKKTNIDKLIYKIRTEIKLKESSIPKCAKIIIKTMQNNLLKIPRAPKNKEELIDYYTKLNDICIQQVIQLILKKNPSAQILKKKQIGHEMIKRELDVHGDRDVKIQSRPHTTPKKQYDDSDEYVPNNPAFNDNMGYDSFGGNYASPFDEISITGIKTPISDPDRPNRNTNQQYPQTRPKSLATMSIQQRMKEELNTRRNENGRDMPPDIDLSLDGSGAKIKAERARRAQQDIVGVNENQSSSFASINEQNDTSNDDDDIYRMLLSPGAPSSEMQNNVSDNITNLRMPILDRQNLLMPQPGNRQGYEVANNNDLTIPTNQPMNLLKIQQLNTNLEKMMADRREMDIQTGQPQAQKNDGFTGHYNTSQISDVDLFQMSQMLSLMPQNINQSQPSQNLSYNYPQYA